VTGTTAPPAGNGTGGTGGTGGSGAATGTGGTGVTGPALEADEVVVRFGGVRALDGVSLALAPGEVLGLIGPNGAGKTTLFDVLSGTIAPTAGRVALGGRDVTRRGATWRSRHGLRRTFQRQQVFGSLSVEDNVLTATEWHGGGGGLPADLLGLPARRRKEARRRAVVDTVLDECGLAGLRREPAGTLPIGRCRMVEMARALVDEPQVLLLDEPTSGLDEAETGQLAAAVRRAAARGTAVVLVEHDVGFVMRLCDRVVVLHLGAVIAEGSPEEVRRDAAVGAAYLGS
jgi:branched-chain amino acid transport system ATP-binding protein